MTLLRSALIPTLVSLYLLFIMSCICEILVFKGSTILSFSRRYDKPATKHIAPSTEIFTDCFLNMDHVLSNLSLPWFLAFDSALMYHRSKTILSDHIDVGVFIDDLVRKRISHEELMTAMTAHQFKPAVKHGRMNDGQEWVVTCPKQEVRINLFVFYRIDGSLKAKKIYRRWAALYHGRCAKMPDGKCRVGFSDFTLQKFLMHEKSFYVPSEQFLVEHYGSNWIQSQDFNAQPSADRMINLIEKY